MAEIVHVVLLLLLLLLDTLPVRTQAMPCLRARHADNRRVGLWRREELVVQVVVAGLVCAGADARGRSGREDGGWGHAGEAGLAGRHVLLLDVREVRLSRVTKAGVGVGIVLSVLLALMDVLHAAERFVLFGYSVVPREARSGGRGALGLGREGRVVLEGRHGCPRGNGRLGVVAVLVEAHLVLFSLAAHLLLPRAGTE